MRDPSDFLIVPSEVDFEFFMRLEILFESDFASNFEQNSLNFESGFELSHIFVGTPA